MTQTPGFGSPDPNRHPNGAISSGMRNPNGRATRDSDGRRSDYVGAGANGSSDFWDQETLIGDVSKNARGEVIRVKRVSKRGRAYVDVRTFYPGNDGQLRPGKGISIPDSLLEAVMHLLQRAVHSAPETVPAAEEYVPASPGGGGTGPAAGATGVPAP